MRKLAIPRLPEVGRPELDQPLSVAVKPLRKIWDLNTQEVNLNVALRLTMYPSAYRDNT